MRILVLSDTHIPTRSQQIPSSLRQLVESQPDLIVHAGDLVSEESLQQLQQYATVRAVAGNMDPSDLRWQLPAERTITCDGYNIGVIHGDGLGPPDRRDAELVRRFPESDIVVVGHTHVSRLVVHDGTYLFNPGSATDPRGSSMPTVGWIETGPAGIQMAIHRLAAES